MVAIKRLVFNAVSISELLNRHSLPIIAQTQKNTICDQRWPGSSYLAMSLGKQAYDSANEEGLEMFQLQTSLSSAVVNGNDDDDGGGDDGQDSVVITESM